MLRGQDFHDDRTIFLLFPYLIGYKAWLLVKLSRSCLLVKKIIYDKTLKYQKIHWENQYNYNHSLIANATMFSRPVFSSTQRNVSCILQQSNVLRPDCMQYYSNCIQVKVLYPSYNFPLWRYCNIPTVWLISLSPLQKKKERPMATKLKLEWNN